eukprot:SAG31_NODE_2639_length_5327_cov_15.148240_3_plen_88_part_00
MQWATVEIVSVNEADGMRALIAGALLHVAENVWRWWFSEFVQGGSCKRTGSEGRVDALRSCRLSHASTVGLPSSYIRAICQMHRVVL